MLNDENLLDIVGSGVLAPSADNRHVFRFDTADGAIRLWPSPEFAAQTERHQRILGLFSLGAVVENMTLRAGELGFSTQTEWFSANGDGPIARLEFQNSTTVVDGLARAIPARHTNRRMYRGPRLSDCEMSALAGEVGPTNEVQLIWLQGDARSRALGLIWRAESERFLRERLHHEIFSSIRFDLSWNESAEWALPPGALSIEAPMRPLFKALRHWPLMRCLTWVGMHRLVGLRAAWLPCWQAPTLGIVATSASPENGAIAAGAAFERIWLRATLLDLALQPLAASVVLPFQTSAAPGASDELRSALTTGWKEIIPGLYPMMLLRIGHAPRPSVRTGRQLIADYRQE